MNLTQIELPRNMKLTKKEEKEIERETRISKGIGKRLLISFGWGLIFFIDIPRRIYRRIRK